MTVKELIAALLQMPQDVKVVERSSGVVVENVEFVDRDEPNWLSDGTFRYTAVELVTEE